MKDVPHSKYVSFCHLKSHDNLWKLGRPKTLVCAFVYMCVCVFMSAPICVYGGQRITPGIFLCRSPPRFFEAVSQVHYPRDNASGSQGIQLKLKLTGSARLASQWTPGICLSPPPPALLLQTCARRPVWCYVVYDLINKASMKIRVHS